MTPDQRIREIEKLAATRKARPDRRCVVISLEAERAKRQRQKVEIKSVWSRPANNCVQMFANARTSSEQRPIQGDLFTT